MVYYIPKRYILLVWAHLGIMIVNVYHASLNFAVVEMVKPPPLQHHNHTKHKHLLEPKHERFNWSQEQVGLLLGAYFYGYFVTHIPGAWLSSRYGWKWFFAIAVVGSAILTFIFPILAQMSYALVLASQYLVGVVQGPIMPAAHFLIANWSPVAERSRYSSIIFSGIHTGTIVSLSLSGILIEEDVLGGWPAMFYIFGVLGIFWFIVWIPLAYNSPMEHPTISKQETVYILGKGHGPEKGRKVPWRAICTSLPVWAYLVGSTLHNYVYFWLILELPTYFQQALGYNTLQNGVWSSFTFIIAFFTTVGSGVVADNLHNSGLKLKSVRRLMSFIGFYPAGTLLVLAGFLSCDGTHAYSLVCMILATAFLSVNMSGCYINNLDISPQFSGILGAIGNTASAITGGISPIVTSYILDNHPTRMRWIKVLALDAGIAISGGTFFIIFLSATVQPWNDEFYTGISNEESLTTDSKEIAETKLDETKDCKEIAETTVK